MPRPRLPGLGGFYGGPDAVLPGVSGERAGSAARPLPTPSWGPTEYALNPDRHAFLLMSRGPGRAAARRVLARRFGEVSVGTNPFDAMARLARAPVELLVASTADWTNRHLDFLQAVRTQGLARRILVLVGADRRRLARASLSRGADAYLLEPLDLGELAAFVGPTPVARETSLDPADLPTFASEVAHAVGNPLQVLSLLLEEGGPGGPDPTRLALRSEVARLRDILGVVSAYARLSPPHKAPTPLGRLVAERVQGLVAAGWFTAEGSSGAGSTASPIPTADPTEVAVDASQVGRAVESLLRFLGSLAPERPARVRVRVKTTNPKAPAIACRILGLHLDEPAFEAARRSVVRLDDRTRDPVPGLALAEAVARGHGGGLSRREGPEGTVVLVRLGPNGRGDRPRPI